MSGEQDLFALFLALADARIAEARAALLPTPIDERRGRGALIPLAVDATLLGIEGVAALASALGRHPSSADALIRKSALDALTLALAALSNGVDRAGDRSGARVDESSLRALAAQLDSAAPSVAAAVVAVAAEPSHGAPDAETSWVPTLPEDLIGPFLDECNERIESLAGRILVIESDGVTANDGEEIRALFRDLHTLKGSSGFAGLARMNRLAHAAEDLVARVRDGAMPTNKPVIDALLLALDRLRALVERAAARAPIDVPVDDAIAGLRDPLTFVAAAPLPSSPQRGAVQPSGSHTTAAGAGTLRIEFERIDQLQNFVNEMVLARSRLGLATTEQLGLARELGRVRRQLQALGRDGRSASAAEIQATAEQVGRSERVANDGADQLESGLASLGSALGQLRDRVMKLRMVPIGRLFSKHVRTARELGDALGKRVVVDIAGEQTELDKVLVEALEDPLVHLVRNAIDHGIEVPSRRRAAGKAEVGTLSLRARQQGGAIIVEVGDDGGGIDPAIITQKAIEKGLVTAEEAASFTPRDVLDLIFRPGFSTSEQVTDVSGRGVGMDVVRESITRLKGTIEIRSIIGVGSTFELRLPLTLAVATVLLARVGGEEVAIPIDAVARTLSASGHGVDRSLAITEIAGRRYLLDPTMATSDAASPHHVPIIDLAATLGLDDRTDGTREVGMRGNEQGHLVVLEAPLADVPRAAIICDALLGRREVVVKPLGPLLSHASCVAGASLIGDRVVLLLDVAAVVRRGLDGDVRPDALTPRAERKSAGRILIADDSDVVRRALQHALEMAGWDVVAVNDGAEALARAKIEAFDVVSTDVMMPKLDGYDLTRALRALPAYDHTPIVMVTSRDQRVDTLRGFDVGVDAYIGKPADVNVLLRTIDEVRRKRHA